MTPELRESRFLLALAERVVDAEKYLSNRVDSVRHTLTNVARSVDDGGAVNSLGELQSSGTMVDAACGRLEEAAEAFQVALHYLPLDVMTDDDRNWFDSRVEKSPRLAREMRRAAEAGALR